MSLCVAEFNRLALDGFGGDRKVRIYSDGSGFAVVVYDGRDFISEGTNCQTYGQAVKLAIEWLDNSVFYM